MTQNEQIKKKLQCSSIVYCVVVETTVCVPVYVYTVFHLEGGALGFPPPQNVEKFEYTQVYW